MKYGIRTSPAQFFFYFVSLFPGAITVRSVVQRYQDDDGIYDVGASERLLYFYVIQYGLQVLLFFLNCIGMCFYKALLSRENT